MTSSKTSKTTEPETNGFTPKRGTGAVAIPGIVRRASADLTVWQNEIEYLKTDMLGQAQDYPDVPDASNLAQKLRKNFGIEAASRDAIRDGDRKGYGTLWLKYPVKIVTGDDGEEYYEADEMQVQRNLDELKPS